MKIVGIEGMSAEQLRQAVAKGGRFVVYQYCISVLVMSFKRSSSVHFVPAGVSATKPGAKFMALSLLAGWWGIPWGPIWTISTVFRNSQGGVDVTSEVLNALAPRAPLQAAN
jgi:hypothetical protein